MAEVPGESVAAKAATAERDKNAARTEEVAADQSQQQSKSSSTASSGSSQNTAQPAGDEPLLVHLVPSLKKATLPRGRIAHHDFLGRAPSMVVPSIEPAAESMLRETQKWRLAHAPVLGHRWISDPASTESSLISCLPESTAHCLGYTDDEYHRYLESEEWSRPETDRLIGLWNSFGGRFVIIADRFNYGQGIAAYKAMEEIKERIADVINRLSAAKGIERTLLYDKDMDRNRRLQLEAIQTRATEQLKEEILLADVMRDMLPGLREQLTERDRLIRLLAPDENGTQTLADILGHPISGIASPSRQAPSKRKKRAGPPSVLVSKSTKKKAEGHAPPDATTPAIEKAAGTREKPSSVEARQATPKQAAEQTQTLPYACLRSSTIRPVRSGLNRQVERILAEHAVPLRPVYPTAETVAKYNELRDVIVQWVDLRKQLGLPTGGSLPASAASSLASSGSTSHVVQAESGGIPAKGASSAGRDSKRSHKKAAPPPQQLHESVKQPAGSAVKASVPKRASHAPPTSKKGSSVKEEGIASRLPAKRSHKAATK